MHSREYEYDGRTYYLHFNSDLSSDVQIGCDEVVFDYETKQFYIPGKILLEFVGEFIGHEIIGKIEQKGGKELLMWLGGLDA